MLKLIKFIVLMCLYSQIAESTSFSEVASKYLPESHEEIKLSYAKIVKKVSPAVVSIYATKKVKVNNYFNPFHFYFGDEIFNDLSRERAENSLGSGVIISENGLIVTNSHLISGSDEIKVIVLENEEYEAEIKLNDEQSDLAILELKNVTKKLPFIEISSSKDLEVGDIVLAIGNPFGLGKTVTSGIISALARSNVGISDFQFFIQTDASINPGNSGGALVDLSGKLIGINTAIYSRSGGSNGIGFAIPAEMVSSLVKNLKTGNIVLGKIIRPWIGINYQTLDHEIKKIKNIQEHQGVIITNINQGSPLIYHGIKTGDIILEIDNHKIASEEELKFKLATYAVGDKAELTILKNGNKVKFTIVMIAPPEYPQADYRFIKGKNPLSGIKIANTSPYICSLIELDCKLGKIVITDIQPGSIADRLGFANKDIIYSIHNKEIHSTEELERLLRNKLNHWVIKVIRNNRAITVKFNS